MDTDISYQRFKKKRPAWSKALRRGLELYLLRFMFFLGEQLPFTTIQKIGRGIGRLAYRVLKKDRGIVELQLSLALSDSSEEQRAKWTKECFLHFGQTLTEFVALHQLHQDFEKYVTVHGAELLEEGRALGRGTIFISPHFGNWELFANYFVRTGYPGKIISKPLYDPRLNEFLLKGRKSENITLVERGSPGEGITILKSLKNNEFLYALIDQDTDVKSMFVPFFGIPARTPTALTTLALKTGAFLISCAVQRCKNGHFEIHLEKVGSWQIKKPTDEQVYETTLLLNQHIEKVILRDPPQWAWFHRRWKRRPE